MHPGADTCKITTNKTFGIIFLIFGKRDIKDICWSEYHNKDLNLTSFTSLYT